MTKQMDEVERRLQEEIDLLELAVTSWSAAGNDAKAAVSAYLAEPLRLALSLIEELRGAMAADDARLLAATERIGEAPLGCDTADRLADCVLAARADVARLERERDEFQETLTAVERWSNVAGVCPFGCDTPNIAQKALAALQREPGGRK